MLQYKKTKKLMLPLRFKLNEELANVITHPFISSNLPKTSPTWAPLQSMQPARIQPSMCTPSTMQSSMI